MNRYINKIVLALSLLSLLAACRKPEQEVVEKKSLSVVASDVIFGVEGGTGSILVEADESITATSERAWCQVSVDGKKIVVSVPEANQSRMSRYARIIIKAGSAEAHVTAQQYGEVFSGIALEDALIPKEGATFTLSYTANMDVKISSDQNWVHFEMVEDENLGKLVKVIVDENAGSGTRFATVSYAAGSNSGSARFTQEPTYAAVTGWTVEDTDGRFVFPDQFDVISVTPPSGMASTSYYWKVVDPSELVGVDVAAILKETADGLKAAADAGDVTFTKGAESKEFKNLPSTATAVILCFDDQNYPTGQYALVEVTVPDRGPKKQLVDGWEVAHAGGTYEHPDQTDSYTVTPKAGFENAKYIATVVEKASIANVDDFAFTTFAMTVREAILAKIASGEVASFDDCLLTGTSTITSENVIGDAYAVIVVFGDNQFYTGDYQVVELTVADLTPAYYKWLGEWSVPRGSGADTWIVSENVPMESFKVSGMGGIAADDFATGACIAIVPYDAATGEMVFKVYENTDVTWQDSSRGTMNALLSGQFTTSDGKTYYTSATGTVICRAKMSEDGLTAALTAGTVTSGGKPYSFSNIRWYGRYTNSSGGRSGVSWNNYETALPNTMTRAE